MNQNRNKIPLLLKRLYEIVAELESLFPGRKFTPDGHLVGSLGEVIAAHDYDLTLLESSTETHDARKGSKQIQIKVTQGRSVAMYGEPEHLLVLRLLKNGTKRRSTMDRVSLHGATLENGKRMIRDQFPYHGCAY